MSPRTSSAACSRPPPPTLGLAPTFLVFAALNLAGALLVVATIERSARMTGGPRRAPLDAWRAHLANPALRASFATGFCILFAFIGTFTFVNFVLVAPPFELGMMRLGAVYLVFVPSLVTTLLAGRVVGLLGAAHRLALDGRSALAGLPPPRRQPARIPGRPGPRRLRHLRGAGRGDRLVGAPRWPTGGRRAASTSLLLRRRPRRQRGARAGLRLARLEGCVVGIAMGLAAVAGLAFGLRLPAARLQPA